MNYEPNFAHMYVAHVLGVQAALALIPGAKEAYIEHHDKHLKLCQMREKGRRKDDACVD